QPAQRARRHDDRDDRGRQPQLGTWRAGGGATVEQGARQQQNRDGEQRQGDGCRRAAQIRTLRREIAEARRRLEQGRAVRRRHQEVDRSILGGRGAPGQPKRHGALRRPQRVLGRATRRDRRRGDNRVFDDDGPDTGPIGRRGSDRLQIDEAQAERRRRHEDGGVPLRPLRGQIGRASCPRARHAAVVVHGQRQILVVAGARTGARRGVEQPARLVVGLGIRRQRVADDGIRRDGVRQPLHRGGHVPERGANALLEPRGGGAIVGSETEQLEREAGEHDDSRGGAAPREQPRRARAPFPRHERWGDRRSLAHVFREYTARERRWTRTKDKIYPMAHTPGLKAALKRGALVAAANWPLVIVQFVAESSLKLMLAVPIVGGAFLVALLLDTSMTDLLRGDARDIVTSIVAALMQSPAALAAFAAAGLLVLVGGSVLTWVVKAGTVALLAEAERIAGPVERPPLRFEALRRASVVAIEPFIQGSRRLWRRYVRIGL